MRFIFPTILLLLLAATPCAAADRAHVFVINSYHAEYPWVVSHNTALREHLADVADLSFFYMDTKRIHPAHHQERADLALAAYRNAAPDIVILTDDNALAYLGRDITESGTPVVYLGINANPRNYFGAARLMTGVLERPLLKRSIVFLQDILGRDMDKCLILFDNGATATAILENVFHGEPSLTFGKTTTDIALIDTFEQWRKLVLTAGDHGYGAIILGLYHTLTDKDGKHVPDSEIAKWTSTHSPVPVFGFWDFSVGRDLAIGGLVLAGRPQGEEAAKLVKRILAGEDPIRIQPVTAEHGRFLFSRSELGRWGITLPDNLAQPSETLEFVD